jgi:hypothetical protein
MAAVMPGGVRRGSRASQAPWNRTHWGGGRIQEQEQLRLQVNVDWIQRAHARHAELNSNPPLYQDLSAVQAQLGLKAARFARSRVGLLERLL